MSQNGNKKPNDHFNQIDAIIAYETGVLSDDDAVILFQGLVNSGLAWQLQGHYGRTAAALIRNGIITQPGSNNNVVL
tara:strand:- start:229 stop:459 length:231 start_codon:yes stop_codon:yes gene_type:complete